MPFRPCPSRAVKPGIVVLPPRSCRWWLLLTMIAACRPSDERPSDNPPTAEYTSQIVLLVSPDSLEVERLLAERGEDFYVIADDAMWYRALARALLDSL